MKTTHANETSIEKMQTRVHELRDEIASHPFSHGLSEEHIAALADCAMETKFAADEVIFREGEFANRFYFLLEGEVALEGRFNDQLVNLGMLGEGEVLGWSWLFPPYCWHFQARAVKPTRAIFFYGTWLRERCEQNHDLGFELVIRMTGIVIQRLQTTRTQFATTLANFSRPPANPQPKETHEIS